MNATEAWKALLAAKPEDVETARAAFAEALERAGGRVEHRERYT